MKSSFVTRFIFFTLVIGACKSGDHSVTLLDGSNGAPLMVLNIKDTRDSTVIPLSGIASDLHFIRLETLPECLINSATYYITTNYILSKTKTAIYQFDHRGTFVRILATRGQGPREFSMSEWLVDEKENSLIISDEQKAGYFLHYDLVTGEYLGDIPKAIPGVTRKFAITAYGSLVCVPYMSPENSQDLYYLYWQDKNGKLIDTIRGPSGLAIYRDVYFSKITEGYRFMPAYTNKDTIYTIRDKKLIPYLAFNQGEPVPEDMEAEGYRSMRIAMETERYLFLNKLQVTKVATSGNNTSVTWNSNDYLFDKQAKKAYGIAGLYNDFTGSHQPIQTFSIQPDQVICCAFQAMEFIGIAERAIENPKSDQKLIGRMKEMLDLVGRDDNPVLLVGKLK